MTDHLCRVLGYINGLVQERHNSSALVMELHLSCTNPLIYGLDNLITNHCAVYAFCKTH